VAAAAPEVKVTRLEDGVFYLTGGTHHSVLVEQADHLVVVEAPQNEARSLAVIAKAKEIARASRSVPGQHAFALRSFRRTAHVRRRRRDHRDRCREPRVLRAGVGDAADHQPRCARALGQGPAF
jgi:hypothetical protein